MRRLSEILEIVIDQYLQDDHVFMCYAASNAWLENKITEAEWERVIAYIRLRLKGHNTLGMYFHNKLGIDYDEQTKALKLKWWNGRLAALKRRGN